MTVFCSLQSTGDMVPGVRAPSAPSQVASAPPPTPPLNPQLQTYLQQLLLLQQQQLLLNQFPHNLSSTQTTGVRVWLPLCLTWLAVGSYSPGFVTQLMSPVAALAAISSSLKVCLTSRINRRKVPTSLPALQHRRKVATSLPALRYRHKAVISLRAQQHRHKAATSL